MNHQAKMVKIAWAGKEVFAPIIGDSGIDFLKNNVDLDLDTFIVIESLPPIAVTRQKLEAMLNIVLQSDPEFIDDALDIMMDSDLTSAIRKFKKKRALRKMYQERQAQMVAEREQTVQAQVAQTEAQNKDKELMTSLELQNKKNEGALQRSLQQSRTKLTSDKIKVIGDLNKPKNAKA
jgi:hypothetical protein